MLALAGPTLLFPGCFTWHYGIAPVAPKQDARIASGPPVLEWTAPPDRGADEVRYDLGVFDRSDILLYEANDLNETRHEIKRSLPAGKYKWTVRAVYLRDGQKEFGPWNRQSYFAFAVVFFQWGKMMYRFYLDEDYRFVPAPPPGGDPTSSNAPEPL